jgi:hypothetical protein
MLLFAACAPAGGIQAADADDITLAVLAVASVG